MEKLQLKVACWAIAVLLLIALILPAAAQVNVTFKLNTSTNLDTLQAYHFVEMRGAQNGAAPDTLPDGNVIDWSATSTLEMDNDGGDYWSITFQMNPDDTLNYKFWTGFDSETGTITDGGWEGGFNPSNGITTDTRTFISGASDTTLDLQYYHPNDGRGLTDQYWRPFETKEDSIAIYFRVNMAGVTESGRFDPEAHTVGLRGNAETSGGTVDWGETRVLLTREPTSLIEGSMWSGVGYVDVDSVTVGSTQAYKFFIVDPNEPDGWENNAPNREFVYTADLATSGGDTTIHWVNFDNQEFIGQEPVDATITFRVSTEALEGLGLFDRGVGDNIALIGAKGWDINPDDNDYIDLNFIPALQEWTVSEPFSLIPGTDIAYKYFVRWDPSRVDESSPNYIPNLTIRFVNDDNESSGWEEPAVTGGDNRVYTYTNSSQQAPAGDFGFDRAFFNSVPANAVFNNAMDITFSINMAPAADPATNTNTHLFTAGTDSAWIQWDGSLFALSQGFQSVGTRDILLDDGDGDMVYEGTLSVDPPGWYQMAFIVSYGNSTDGYITNGGGVQRGRRYYQYVEPTSIDMQGNTTWPDAFALNILDWQQDNLTVEEPPNLVTDVEDTPGNLIPLDYALDQNYPNPFNPETTIRYQVAAVSEVKIQVYNLVGQLVKTLVDDQQPAGTYTIQWTGEDFRGQPVSSGVYFLKMRAGDFNNVRKMALVR